MEALMINKLQTQHHGLARLGLDQDGVRVLVIGLGTTGVSVIRFLKQNNINVAVLDSRANPPGLKLVEEEFRDIAVFTGGFNQTLFDIATHIIVSPGVSLQEEEIQAAAERGIPVFGDIDVFAVCVDTPIACITGSNGKSTVTTLLGEMAMRANLDVRVGGNLGVPALDLLTDKQADLYVLELSSFQLERTSQLRANVAAVLNISVDHMDRYSSVLSYTNAKERIFYGEGVAIINRQDEAVCSMAIPVGREIISFGLDKPQEGEYGVLLGDSQILLAKGDRALISTDELKIKGLHNQQNVLAAMAMADALHIPQDAQKQALLSFEGLDHRTQWVADINGVTWINDSKATNPGACLAAIVGLQSPIVLIAGGDGKGADFDLLSEAIEAHVSSVILIGKDANRFKQEAIISIPTMMADDIEHAVQLAFEHSSKGGTVLLSPACASLDQFENYQERGDRFIAAVGMLQS